MRMDGSTLDVLYGERLPRRQREIIRRDRRVPSGVFFVVFLAIAAALGVLGTVYRFPAGLLISVIVITLYLPLNFLFFCNVVKVGPDREFVWMVFFVVLCGGSVAMTGELLVEYILPIAVVGAGMVCVDALRDPVVRFRRGLHRYEGRDWKGALREFERALELDDEWGAPLLFMGLALVELGEGDEGKERIEGAFGMQPSLREFAERKLKLDLGGMNGESK